MIELDGREVKVGDRLWCSAIGWGTVRDSLGAEVPISMSFDDGGYVISFTSDGMLYNTSVRSLFWDEVKIDPPKPKIKVKKWRWAYEIFDAGHKYSNVTQHLSDSDVLEFLNRNTQAEIIGKIEATEIEEYV